MNHMYENPVETEVGLTARILSVCVKIKIKSKNARYICARTQRTLFVTSRIINEVTGSQFDSSCEPFDNVSAEMYKNKCILQIY